MTTDDFENETLNRTKPAFKEEATRRIIFNLTVYHIPESEGQLFDSLYTQLNKAIEDKDLYLLRDTLKALQPYKIKIEAKPKYRQTEIVDQKTGKVIHG